jgi:uncharacterized repeat protein (TIGR03806 family)
MEKLARFATTSLLIFFAASASACARSMGDGRENPLPAGPPTSGDPDGGAVGDAARAGTDAPSEPSGYGIDTRPKNATCLALASSAATAPDKLSNTGCVLAAAPSSPAAGLIPYDVNAPLWSDGASKRRWLALPDDADIHIEADGHFSLPKGAVLVKEFSIAGKRVETRLFMHCADDTWGGYSYKWDAAETDARLVAANGETGTWTYPSRAACLTCHTSQAGYSLGLETGQLNRAFDYPNGRTANQLDTLGHIGLFDAPLEPSAQLPVYARVDDTSRPLEDRARAYLHANCAGCHRSPNGTFGGKPDFRYATPLAAVGVCHVAPKLGTAGGPAGSLLVAPGAPAQSVVSLRMHALGGAQMPPLAHSVLDTAGLQILDGWISSIALCPADLMDLRFDEKTGANAGDASGADNGGVLKGGASWSSAGRSGGAVSLNGTDAYVQYGAGSSALSFAAGAPFTMAAWINVPPSRSYGVVVSQRSSQEEGAAAFLGVGYDAVADSPGAAIALVRQDNGTRGFAHVVGPRVNDAQWHLLTVVREGCAITLYVDGAAAGTASGAEAGGAVTTDRRTVGTDLNWVDTPLVPPAKTYLEGLVDDMRVFSRALSASEVQALFKSTH